MNVVKCKIIFKIKKICKAKLTGAPPLMPGCSSEKVPVNSGVPACKSKIRIMYRIKHTEITCVLNVAEWY